LREKAESQAFESEVEEGQEEEKSPFGKKITDAPCRVVVPPSPASEATVEIWTEGVLVKPKQGSTVFVPYTEAMGVDPSNYRIEVTTASRVITVSALGLKYDHFSQKLTDAWGDALARALLMEEPTEIYEARATYVHTLGDRRISGTCRARICQTSLIVLPSNSPPTRVSLPSIKSVTSENYVLRVETSRKGTFEFSKMGVSSQYFSDKLVSAQRDIESISLKTVRELIPSASYEDLQAVARLMPEGRAAKRRDIEAFSAELWVALERKAEDSPLGETYKYLVSLSERDHVAIGVKKSMLETYVWFLVPVFGSKELGGNCIAMEVTSKSGHATYLFRVIGRRAYPSADRSLFLEESDRVGEAINEAMIATGFRREPIYLSSEKLSSSEHTRYLYAARNLDELRLLREKFFARLIHTDFEGWKSSLHEALVFNTQAVEDQARWARSQLEPEEEAA